jgi:SAM-dependent methyltransferase
MPGAPGKRGTAPETEWMVNADEIAYWNADAGDRWVRWQEQLDAAFAPITAAAIASANPRGGEAALDVGCGCGATVLGLARGVGSGGRVVGVDVSEPMLAVAESRVRAAGLTNVTLLLSDASSHPFEPATFDLAFSRFGVMFFENPVEAFANIRRALRPDGRIGFVCWRGLGENPWFHVPLDAVLPLVPKPPKPDPEAPGPMAFADPDRVRRVLAGAGYRNVRIDAFDTRVSLGARANAVDFLLQIGPASRLLEGADAGTRATAAERIAEALRSYETADGVTFDVAVWVVGASV